MDLYVSKSGFSYESGVYPKETNPYRKFITFL